MLGYFHLDTTGKLTTPTINDDAPHLSEPTRLAENRQFRDEVVRSFASQLEIKRNTLLAEAAPLPKKKIVPQKTKEKPVKVAAGAGNVGDNQDVCLAGAEIAESALDFRTREKHGSGDAIVQALGNYLGAEAFSKLAKHL